MYQVRHPHKPLAPLLAVLDDVCGRVREQVSAAGPAPVGYASFDRAILMRGLNLLEATRLLSEPLHWEVAATCARQLYELVLNMEWLASMPDRETASNQFALFGMLQQVRAKEAENDYARATGRTSDEEYASRLVEVLAREEFDQFRGKPRADGSPKWATSWNGKTVWDMAKESSNPIRKAQYNQLFVAWSEEAHGAPGALIDSMFRVLAPDWHIDLLTNDLREMSQIVSMALFLFFELWMSLVNVPRMERDKWEAWLADIRAYVEANWRVSPAAHNP